jgi:hypothetical protein
VSARTFEGQQGLPCIDTVAGMATETRADPAELCRLGDQMLTSSEDIDGVWRANVDALNIPVSAFGNSGGAPGAHATAIDTVSDAEGTVSQFVTVLQGDMDRLYRVAFVYEHVDEQNAANTRGPGRAR